MNKLLHNRNVLIGGGAVLLLLAYLYYRNRSTSSASSAPTDTIGTTTDPASSDYATLAGMAQQGSAQETADVGTLTGQINSLTGQESSDISALTGTIGGLESQLNNIPAGPAGPAGASGIGAGQYRKLQQQLAKVMASQEKQSARLTSLLNQERQREKTGKKSKASSNPHTNAHHPAGTAGSAVGRRSHEPKTPAWRPVAGHVTVPKATKKRARR